MSERISEEYRLYDKVNEDFVLKLEGNGKSNGAFMKSSHYDFYSRYFIFRCDDRSVIFMYVDFFLFFCI